MSEYGPDKKCRRTACAELPEHKGGVHLNQRHKLYDGPSTLLQVLPIAVRDSARKIVHEAPALMPEVVDLGQHIEFLRRQVAAASVDRDRQVREAMRRSGDCEVHGQELAELAAQRNLADGRADRNEKARLVLLSFLNAVDELIDKPREGLTTAEILAALATAAKKARAAHTRAWK